MGEEVRAAAAGPGGGRTRVVACLAGISLERGVPTEEISEYIREADNLVWVDVQDPGEAELSLLLEEFGFHPLALEDVAKGEQRPKVDEYKGYLFIVTYGVLPGPGSRDLRTVEVDFFIGRNYVVTVHRGPVPALEDAYARWTRGGEMLREGVGFLVYTLTDALIDSYFPVIDAIEDELDEAELAVLTRASEDALLRLLELKRTLFTLRRVLAPLRESFNTLLRRDQPLFSGATHVYFQDVYDHTLRILDLVEIQREMVTGVLEAQLTVISNRLNRTMRTLTVVTVAVALASSVFGAWGMNFTRMPLAEAPWGFWAVFGGVMLLVATSMVVGRVRGWL